MCGKLFRAPSPLPPMKNFSPLPALRICLGTISDHLVILEFRYPFLLIVCVPFSFPFFLHPCFSFQKVIGLYLLYRRFLCRLSKKFEKNSRNFVFSPWQNGTFELKNQRLTIDKKLSGCHERKKRHP